MFQPYLRILAKPGAKSFSGAALIARLPMSMVGIGIVLMISDASLYGSYGLAGQITATFVVTQAIAAPQIAKLIDRHGQSRIMRPAIAISSSSLAALAFAAMTLAPRPVLFLLAGVAGLTVGAIGALVRTRWNSVVSDEREMHTAYSLESTLDELVFVVGPVLATYLATSVHPTAGLAVAVVAAVVGGYWFLAQKDTEPIPTGSPRSESRASVLRSPALVGIVLLFACLGTVFGSVDVATVAFAEEAGNKGAAGTVLATFALGSLISGFGYGARQWASSPWLRFTVCAVALGVGVSLFSFVSSLVVLAAVMFVVGFTIAPLIITGNGLVQQLVPPARLTEGLTWIGTALGVGVSVGASVSGPLIDADGSHAGFLVATVSGVLVVLAALTLALARRGPRTRAGNPAPPVGVVA